MTAREAAQAVHAGPLQNIRKEADLPNIGETSEILLIPIYLPHFGVKLASYFPQRFFFSVHKKYMHTHDPMHKNIAF